MVAAPKIKAALIFTLEDTGKERIEDSTRHVLFVGTAVFEQKDEQINLIFRLNGNILFLLRRFFSPAASK